MATRLVNSNRSWCEDSYPNNGWERRTIPRSSGAGCHPSSTSWWISWLPKCCLLWRDEWVSRVRRGWFLVTRCHFLTSTSPPCKFQGRASTECRLRSWPGRRSRWASWKCRSRPTSHCPPWWWTRSNTWGPDAGFCGGGVTRLRRWVVSANSRFLLL